MPAVSKAQQRFMGMVHAADKGETPASPEVAKVSADMKDSDAKDFASTKHDGLPDHVKEQLKSVVREVIREKSGMNEMSSNDVHFKHIMKMYDRGGSFTKKKIAAVICKDPKASRKDIEEVLFDSDYKEITEFEDELGLKEIREKYNSVKEDATELPQATIPAAVKAKLQLAIEKIKDSKLSNNAKLQLLAQVIDAIGIDKSQLSNIASKIRSKMESVVTEEFKHVIHVDTPTQVVSKPVAAQIMALAKKGVRSKDIGLEMGFVGNAKLATDTFQKVKNQIYFALDKRNESVNEAKPAVVGNVNAFGPSKVLGKGGKVLGFVPDTPNAIATLIQDYPNVQAIEFKSPFFFDFNSYKSIKKGDKAWKELMSRGVDKVTKAALKKDFQLKESVNEAVDIKDGKYRFYSKDGVGYLTYGGKELSSGDFDWDDGSNSYWMSHSSWGGQKAFDTGKDVINYFKSKKITTESVNEEHDCGCNENHDCGCGGVHEHHIKEDLSADANGIAGLTASRANAVKDFLEKNNINSNKLYLFLKKGNLKDRMDFVTALVGKPGNPIQKKVIAQFSN